MRLVHMHTQENSTKTSISQNVIASVTNALQGNALIFFSVFDSVCSCIPQMLEKLCHVINACVSTILFSSEGVNLTLETSIVTTWTKLPIR